jgi:hypothetical protein
MKVQRIYCGNVQRSQFVLIVHILQCAELLSKLLFSNFAIFKCNENFLFLISTCKSFIQYTYIISNTLNT